MPQWIKIWASKCLKTCNTNKNAEIFPQIQQIRWISKPIKRAWTNLSTNPDRHVRSSKEPKSHLYRKNIPKTRALLPHKNASSRAGEKRACKSLQSPWNSLSYNRYMGKRRKIKGSRNEKSTQPRHNHIQEWICCFPTET